MRKQKFIKALTACAAAFCAFTLTTCAYLCEYLPDEYSVGKNEEFLIQDYTTIKYDNHSNNEIKVNISNSNSTSSGTLTLFNIIPLKEVNVHTTEKKFVVPCGTIFGVKFYTKGVVVIKCDDIAVNGTSYNPGNDCGLTAGDTLIEIDGEEISCCEDISAAIDSKNGASVEITYIHGEETLQTSLTPVQTSIGQYKAGLWIRDSCAGLGTMTFYDPDTNCFAALGHGICDSDTNKLLPLNSAEIVNAEINNITKGSGGSPGCINGYFENDTAIGEAKLNTETGLYGKLYEPAGSCSEIEIANIQEVKRGKAQILCTLDENEPKLYDIEITHVDYDENNKTKNLQITATDEELISKTGGIVQGMSGSPILQNGKLVGAVTHVLISNSNKGFGIFAQNMYEEIEKSLI